MCLATQQCRRAMTRFLNGKAGAVIASGPAQRVSTIMTQAGGKVVIIGGGIAGLCAAVYAQKCGYQAEILEMHDMAGGLATSWRRGPYTFETCLHWLLGSHPNGEMHAQWQEVFDIDKLTFVDPQEFAHIETDSGETLSISTNLDRMERELLARSPQDATEIRRLVSDVRGLRRFKMLVPAGGWAGNLMAVLNDLSLLPLLRRLMNTSCFDYGMRFKDPLLREVFGMGEMGQLSAIALFFSLAWMSSGNAGYPVGGSQAVIRLIEEKLAALGGRVRFRTRVERILVDNDAATGVRLADGEIIPADWVISAADGHSTLNELLGGKYITATYRQAYERLALFPSYLQVSLGIAKDMSTQPAHLTRLLASPIELDPGTQITQVAFRIFNFDPTFAPAGKTAVTCFLPTRNVDYWVQLREQHPERYHAEKQRIADAVIAILERKLPNFRQAVEVVDVSTPATVIRYTGNWKGSMEGWLLSPGNRMRALPMTLPSLRRFVMVGQWIMPGGGLPSGLMTARPAIQAICRQDRVPFTP